MKHPYEATAERLRAAYTEGQTAPLRDTIAPDDIDGGYAIQSINTAYWKNAGRRPIGRKIGLTSPAVQRQLGVSQPDYGVLFEDMVIAPGTSVAIERLLQGRAEAEIALVLGRDLDNPNPTALEVMRAVDYVLPAIEICDSRILDWRISIADTIADNASSALFVLGDQPRRLDAVDLRTCGMVLEVNGVCESLGVGAACLGHPLNATLWLARSLAARGEPLCAGEVILTGALGPMTSLRAASHVRAEIAGLGHVSFSVETSSTS